MRGTILLIVLVVAGCRRPVQERALIVEITLEAGLESKCLQVEIGGNESRYTDGYVLKEKNPVRAGIPQGRFPDMVRVRALGFSDERCTERSDEESDFAPATFDPNEILVVGVTMKKRIPRTETRCTDGLDDDRDGQTDCADQDCNEKACTSTDRCLVAPQCRNGTCQSSNVLRCVAPPSSCFEPMGTCQSSDGGCSYQVSTTRTCVDADACTLNERCLADGGCEGTPVVCQMMLPPMTCRSPAGTCADGGCVYAVTPDAGCDDGNSCTVDDRCSDQASCGGARVSCPATACGVFTNACQADGGCVYARADAGTDCDGGVCSLSGDCLPRFPYAPTNFQVVQLRAPPPAPTVLDCGETVIDTSGAQVQRPLNWCNGQPFEASIIRQDGGGDALLVSLAGLVLTHDGGLRLIGDKPVIFGVFGDVSITGSVVAEGGDQLCGSAAGNDGASTIAGNGGGSGAGFATPGARGGTDTGVSGGAASGIEANLGPAPLRGGCRGGRGGDQTIASARGGGGVQISAAGRMAISGTIAAPGFGGAGGERGSLIPLMRARGGNGGGSGGLVVLEAAELTISGGAVTANGGGGGEGGALGDGDRGANGRIDSATPAPGGGGNLPGVARGGNGAAGSTGATEGEGGGLSGSAAGGGGGLGVVFVRGTTSCSLNPAATFSPPANPDGGCS